MDNFKKTIIEFDQQLSFGQIKLLNTDKLHSIKPDAIVIVGMGGSGQVGDMVAELKKELRIPVPVMVWKNYGLPEISFTNPLFVFVSFSGNTEETISGFSEVKNKAAVCSGGKLLKLAKTEKSPLATFNNTGIKPRQSGGSMFYGAISILMAVFPEIKIGSFSLKNSEKEGKNIAKRIKDKMVLIYSSQKNTHIAYNWKTRLNETSKIPAFCGAIPEICHNEIEIFENKGLGSKMIALLIRDKSDNAYDLRKMQKIEKLFKYNKIKYLSLELRGRNGIEKMWASLLLADWASYYLAKLNKVSPPDTALIDKLKLLK